MFFLNGGKVCFSTFVVANHAATISADYPSGELLKNLRVVAAGLRLNPPKDERIAFSAGDQVIVVTQQG